MDQGQTLHLDHAICFKVLAARIGSKGIAKKRELFATRNVS
jgi:hypothetical protein